MLREAQPFQHTDRALPVPGRHQQIGVNVGAHLAWIQPLGEHRTLEHKRVNALTTKRTRNLSRKRINRKITRQLITTVEVFRAHRLT